MRQPMNGFEACGEHVDLEIVDNSSDRCLYISNDPECVDSYDLQLVGLRGTDLELVYETLKEFLGK